MKFITPILLSILVTACIEYTPKSYDTFEDYPAALDASLWLDYNSERTIFSLWSPVAKAVKVNLYKEGNGGEKLQVYYMSPSETGIWSYTENSDLAGYYYTYQIKINEDWLDETPGIYASAVGVNGDRAMILDLNITNPDGWVNDKGPSLVKMNDAIIYELQVRDITIHNTSGSSSPGKYLGLV
ncbi:MAG: pullulanase, partial [Marinoscillum sp.]